MPFVFSPFASPDRSFLPQHQPPGLTETELPKNPEETLLHHKHAPGPPDSCGFFKNLRLPPSVCRDFDQNDRAFYKIFLTAPDGWTRLRHSFG